MALPSSIKSRGCRKKKVVSGRRRGRRRREKVATLDEQGVAQRLERLEHLIQEMNDRLKSIESRLSQK